MGSAPDTMRTAETPFAPDYHSARGLFLQALDAFEASIGRRFVRARCVLDAAEDLSIDVAELRPERVEKLYVVVSGIHGVEGFAGNAIQRALLSHLLSRLPLATTGVLLVHALNPVGMQRLRRVNAGNVDLNRNFAIAGSSLYATDSTGYGWLASAFEPACPYGAGPWAGARYVGQLARALRSHGFAALRQATLAGQYASPRGIFYGGKEPEPETRFFQQIFDDACTRYQEILLTDLHTGYGERGCAYPLFGRADSLEMQAFSAQGVRDARGRNQSYDAHGDLVGYCYATAKQKNPTGVFNGVVIELGTHGLGAVAQVQDLHAVVRENQVAHYGASTPQVAADTRRRFCELFNPSDSRWQRQVLAAALDRIESLLAQRGFLSGG